MRVEVYFNLHKHTFSVRQCSTGRVILHTDEVHIRNPQFVVRQSGRERVLREGKKNVHAFVRGEVTLFDDEKRPTLDTLTYNPYRHRSFVRKCDGMPVHKADRAMLRLDNGVPVIQAEKGVYL